MSLRLARARLLPFAASAPPVGADALLVEGDWIAALGASDELRRLHPNAQLIDLDGAVLTPGWTDTHTHFYEWARKLAGVDVTEARSLDEIVSALRAYALDLPHDVEWIGGGGWDPQLVGTPGLDRQLLDQFFPDRPVILEARDFHTLWVNSIALARAGLLDRQVADLAVPPGGRIGAGDDGKPDGLLYETAWELVRSVRPAEPATVSRRWLDAATDLAHQWGVTGIHTMEDETTLGRFRGWAEADALRLRVCFHTPLDHLDDRIGRGEPTGIDLSQWLRLGGVKIFMDGSLGSRSARMLDPYPDGSHGTQILAREQLHAHLRRAARAGIGGAVHAIGDATVLEVAEVFAQVRAEFGPALLQRMEHAQCVPDDAIDLLARARVFCAMQPVHLFDDGDVLPLEWPKATKNTYRCRDLLDAGVGIGFGSDAPVASLDPRRGIEIAMSRRFRDDAPPHEPPQSVDAIQALHAYTAAAVAGGGREDLGSLEVGKLADLTAVDDVLDKPPSAWRQARVRLTMVGGDIVHEKL